MKLPDIPENERERLAELKSYRILDTAPETEFDAITRLIAYICRAPIALVSLIDEQRQWFKSAFGLDIASTPRDISVCGHAINQSGLFVVPDLSQDPRFVDNPLIVEDPKLRFYAGAVLRGAQGHALGTLCVLDNEPRVLDSAQLDALETLARHVTQLLDAKRATAELAKTLVSRQRLIATVAHDLRSPMQVVAFGAASLRTMVPNVAPVVERIERANASMRELVEDLLDYETLEANGLVLNKQPTRVSAVLDEAVDTYCDSARGCGLELVTKNVEDATVLLDASRIRQVLSNLVGNALKVVPAGGRIELSSAVHPNHVRFCVTDTGPGLSAEAHALVFEPFWRGDVNVKGAGLGLTISRRIVEAHGGSLGVESKLGSGATFWFDLPR